MSDIKYYDENVCLIVFIVPERLNESDDGSAIEHKNDLEEHVPHGDEMPRGEYVEAKGEGDEDEAKGEGDEDEAKGEGDEDEAEGEGDEEYDSQDEDEYPVARAVYRPYIIDIENDNINPDTKEHEEEELKGQEYRQMLNELSSNWFDGLTDCHSGSIVLKNQFKQIEKIQTSSELKTFLMFHATKFYIPVDINPRSIYKNSEDQVEFLKFFAKKNHVNIWFENTIYLIPFKAFSNFPQY